MSFDGDDDELSPARLLGLLVGPAVLGSSDPHARGALADIARQARLPRTGGLFGGDYARFMASRTPPRPPSQRGAIAGSLGAVFGPQAAGPAGGGPQIYPPEDYQIAGPAVVRGEAAPAQAAPPDRQPEAQALATSPRGQAFIRRWEVDARTGLPYSSITPDAENNPTFGYGHKVEAVENPALQARLRGLGPEARTALIDDMFQKDLARAEQRVKDRLGETVKSLSQGQFDALVADAFNAGGGGALGPNMLRNILDADMAEAGKQFNAVWATDAKTGKKDVMTGLVRRSLEEAAMFNRGDYSYAPTDREIEAARQAALARAAAKAR